jgi:hypothetical protein
VWGTGVVGVEGVLELVLVLVLVFVLLSALLLTSSSLIDEERIIRIGIGEDGGGMSSI